MNRTKAFIAAMLGMLITSDKRFRLTPSIHIPTRAEITSHQRANPGFKRRRKEVAKKKHHR